MRTAILGALLAWESYTAEERIAVLVMTLLGVTSITTLTCLLARAPWPWGML